MKVKQIVGEHKKGVRAKIYTKKPQNTIAPAKPKKPEGPVSEDAKITKSDTTGVEITADDGVKTTLPPEKAAALTPDPSNPNEYDLNPAATSPTGDTATGPKVGANVEIKTAEAVSDDLSTMPTDEYVKGIYAAAAENGMDAPEAEAVKKQMVLAPNGEVDIMATMQKALQAFQSPEFKQMLADLDALVKQAEAQQTANPELARIQELSGMTDEDTVSPRFMGYQTIQHDNGDTTDDYSQGPMAVKVRKDAKGNTVSSDAQYNIGPDQVQMNRNQVGVNTLTAQGPNADAIVGTNASAQRKGVDPAKFAQFKKQAGVQESAELTAMLKIAGLR
jgi:hypothetical protein